MDKTSYAIAFYLQKLVSIKCHCVVCVCVGGGGVLAVVGHPVYVAV